MMKLGQLTCAMGFHKDKLVHSEYVSFHWRNLLSERLAVRS